MPGFGTIIFTMPHIRRNRNFAWLGGLVLIAGLYGGLIAFLHTITGQNKIDGIIGVLLGLYTFSNPTANLLDMILYGRYEPYRGWTRQQNLRWVAANVLVMVVAYFIFVIGTTQFVVAR